MSSCVLIFFLTSDFIARIFLLRFTELIQNKNREGKGIRNPPLSLEFSYFIVKSLYAQHIFHVHHVLLLTTISAFISGKSLLRKSTKIWDFFLVLIMKDLKKSTIYSDNTQNNVSFEF